jgi:cytochrome c oxidase subunit 4
MANVGVDLRTWLGLLALLALNVAATFMFPGWFDPWLHPGIAALQAAWMMAVFMALRRSSAVVRLAAVAGLFWLFLLFALTFSDYASRTGDVAMGRVSNPPVDSAREAGGKPLAAKVPQQDLNGK